MGVGVLLKPTDGRASVMAVLHWLIPVDQMFTDERGNNQILLFTFAVGGLCCIFTLFSKIFSTVISTKLH